MCLKVELVRGMPPKQKASEEKSNKTLVEKLKKIKEGKAKTNKTFPEGNIFSLCLRTSAV